MEIRVNQRIPELCALFVALIWGLGWIPVRYLNQIGFDGIWGGTSLNVGAAIFLLLYVGLITGFTKTTIKSSAGAFIVGFGAATFFIAISFTDVANAVLLFYLSPAWSTIIECLFLGRKWRWPSLVAIGSSLLGIVLVFEGVISFDSINIGDIMAFVSGLCWSIGISFLFTSPTKKQDFPQLALIAMVGSVLISILIALIGGPQLGTFPDGEILLTLGYVPLLFGTLYFAPLIALSLWTSTLIAPALMSFLLSMEILSGIGSSYILLDEPFGPNKFAGTFFIILGAIVEFLIPNRITKREVQQD
ncbi:MAG: DMT family transporter [Rhodobacteraceae bacterium]|nr:DMT family transporter [Paracoccaceae bacterium]MDE2738266.1 DMT family transporter [Paracoccaceae bacterium]MYG42559.1 DMT family transporter [Paracoccaceae bacterium]